MNAYCSDNCRCSQFTEVSDNLRWWYYIPRLDVWLPIEFCPRCGRRLNPDGTSEPTVTEAVAQDADRSAPGEGSICAK